MQALGRARFLKIAKALPALVMLALLTGCGGGGGSSATAPTPPVLSPGPLPPVPIPAPTLAVSAPALSNFTATLSENAASISVGGTVNYTVTLANTSSTPATILTNTSNGVSVPIATLRVSSSSGQTLYPPVSQPGARPQDGPPPPPSSGVVTLQPGQSLSQTRALAVFSKADTDQAVATFTVAANLTDTPQTVTLNALPLTVK